MIDIVECIRHCQLKSCVKIFQTKWEFAISKSSPWEYICDFILISREYVYLIVARKSIHEGKNFIFGTIINNLVDRQSWIIVVGTSFINISVINTYLNNFFSLLTTTIFDTQLVKGMGQMNLSFNIFSTSVLIEETFRGCIGCNRCLTGLASRQVFISCTTMLGLIPGISSQDQEKMSRNS